MQRGGQRFQQIWQHAGGEQRAKGGVLQVAWQRKDRAAEGIRIFGSAGRPSAAASRSTSARSSMKSAT